MAEIAKELSLAARTLARHPLLSTVVVLTLALGVGATLAIFGVVRATLLAPLPYEHPDELTSITWQLDSGGWNPLSPLDLTELDSIDSLDAVTAYHPWTFNASSLEPVERLSGIVVYPNALDVLGVDPALGHRFSAEPDGPIEVLLSDGLWRRRFGADPHIVGKALVLDDEPTTIAGVMPAGFRFPATRPSQIWKAGRFGAETPRQMRFLMGVGRLAAGHDVDAARAETTLLSGALEREFPDANEGLQLSVEPLAATVVRGFENRLVILQLAVLAALLLAGFNLAMVQLGRAESQRGETAVRYALGARQIQVLRTTLWENALLGLAGGLLGAAVARIGTELLVHYGPRSIHRLEEARYGAAELAATVGLGLLCGLAIGLVPSLVRRRDSLAAWLRSGVRASAAQTARRLLVAIQVAVTLVLVVGFGLFVRSLTTLGGVDTGFEPESVVATGVSLPAEVVREATVRGFALDLMRRLEALPEVDRVATAVAPPLTGGYRIDHEYTLVGEQRSPDAAARKASIRPVSPGFFEVLRIPLLAGRAFGSEDTTSSEAVVVVNEAFAREVLGDPSAAVGRQIEIDLDYGDSVGRIPAGARRIVGVVGDVRQVERGRPDVPALYVSTFQAPWAETRILVRTQTDPATMLLRIEEAVRGAAPTLPVTPARRFAEETAGGLAPIRFQTGLLGAFAVLALLLMAVGLYGSLSVFVARRGREIGLRMALGADSLSTRWLIVRQALTVAGLGLALGLVGCWWLARLVDSLLVDVEPTDAITYTTAVSLMAGVCLLAAWWPARRATQVDPMVCLRDD
ncbi:MAG: ADOP family duplicated permease [Acidobacteriota bacterium]